MARSTASACPEITVCPGPFMFAGETTRPLAASAQTASMASRSSPITAAIAPMLIVLGMQE